MKKRHQQEVARFEGRPFHELLDQTKWWKSNEGWVRRSKMTPAHRLHAMGWMEDNAIRIVSSMERSYMSTLLTFPDDPSDGVFAAMCGIEGEHQQMVAAVMESDPAERKEACAQIVRETDMYQAMLDDVLRLADRMSA